MGTFNDGLFTGGSSGGGGGGSVPTGTGFVHITGGAQDAAARAVDLSTADVTGTLPAANLPDASTSAKGAVKLAQDLGGTAAAPTVVAATGAAGVFPVSCAAMSVGTNPASAGAIRLPNDGYVRGRNVGNTGDIFIARVDIYNEVAIGANDSAGLLVTGPLISLIAASNIRFSPGFGQMASMEANGLALYSAGSYEWGGGAKNLLYLRNAGTPLDPAAPPSNGGVIEVTGGALKYLGTSGTLTVVAPASPHCPRCGTDVGISQSENHLFGEELVHCHACELRTGNGVVRHFTNFFERFDGKAAA